MCAIPQLVSAVSAPLNCMICRKFEPSLTGCKSLLLKLGSIVHVLLLGVGDDDIIPQI